VISSNDASLTRVDLDAGTVVSHPGVLGGGANRIEATAEGTRLAVANSASDDVTVLDPLSGSAIATLPLPPGANPWAVEIVGARLFVSALLHDTVYELDLDTGALVGSIPVGKAPEGMCVAGGRLWVANTGFDFDTFGWSPGSVTPIDLATSTPLAAIPVELNPQECLAGTDGLVHVVCTGDFGATGGAVSILDPAAGGVVDTFPVGGYPGGGSVHPGGFVFLNVTTPSFGSEIHAYRIEPFAWLFDDTDPLLPTTSFYGNPRATPGVEILVPDFPQDLLLAVDPGAPDSPIPYLVGDGPIDVVFVESESPVPLLISGLAATVGPDGVLLTWRAETDADLARVAVESRRAAGGAWQSRAELAPAREMRWLDDGAEPGAVVRYRVGAFDHAGHGGWTELVLAVPRRPASRLAIRRVAPNPSRGEVELELVVPRATAVLLEVLDVAGRRVTTLAPGSRPTGPVGVRWDGRDGAGRAVAPGMYFVRATAGGETATARVLRVR
jgi:hypothetical protein